MSKLLRYLALIAVFSLNARAAGAAEPLHDQIDKLILAKAAGKPVSAASTDAEFLRRVYLDFTGKIPTLEQTKRFLADQSPQKRTKLIDDLLSGPEYSVRMADLFHVMLMERLGDHPEWMKYLRNSFEKNKPWNQMAREILRADPVDEANRGAAFFHARRLENYGQNPVDYPALTRDIGRLFLGKNLQCAQCHDHLFIDEYKQQHFQGLFAFVQNAYLVDAKGPTVGEKPTTTKLGFMSVFKKQQKSTGPALPGGMEFDPPMLKKGEEFIKAPDAKAKTLGVLKFSPLSILSEQMPSPKNADFSRNIVNRLWFIMMGRGLVHPLDLHHAGNPPSHPELLDLLAREFVDHKLDIKWLLHELALTQTYQRSTVLSASARKQPPELFLTAIERRLSAEQLLWSTLEATGEREAVMQKPSGKIDSLETARAKFVKAFANSPREPEEDYAPGLTSALFLSNDPLILSWLTPRTGNRVDRLAKLTDPDKIAEELYLAILTRPPSTEERETVKQYLAKSATDKRENRISQLVWALLASTEFSVNH
jgi:hypothetical protein